MDTMSVRTRLPRTPAERRLGKRLRARRKKLKLPIARVAYEIGLHVNALRNVELGHFEPSLQTLRQLVKRYAMSADEILFGRTQPH